MKYSFFAAGVAIASTLIPAQAIAATFSGLYVFGDSLSDTGNLFTTTEVLSGSGQPGLPYANGRVSNGDIWIDYLANDLGLTPTPVADVVLKGASPTQGINFAFAGSTTGFDNTLNDPLYPPLPALQNQLGFFNILSGGVADANALYVVWGGANDYLPTISSFVPYTTPDITIGNLSFVISTLYTLGARNFLIPNLPDLGQVPLVVNTPLSGFLDNLTTAHNTALSALLDDLERDLSGIGITRLDVNTLFDEAITDGSFAVVDQPCFNSAVPSLCSNPDDYLFWDFIHPTTKAHERIGELAVNTLNSDSQSVPEPVSAVGLIAVGLVGAGLSRRSR